MRTPFTRGPVPGAPHVWPWASVLDDVVIKERAGRLCSPGPPDMMTALRGCAGPGGRGLAPSGEHEVEDLPDLLGVLVGHVPVPRAAQAVGEEDFGLPVEEPLGQAVVGHAVVRTGRLV